MKILVTGATGKLGSKVMASLLNQVSPDQLFVSVRNPEKAENYKNMGIGVRKGDFEDLSSLIQAFDGMDRVLIISTDGDNESRIRQHKNAVAAAKAANVKFVAYTSVGNATTNVLDLAEVHRVTEKAILDSGIKYSFLRNNWYLENEIASIQGVLAGAPWLTSAGQGKVGWAAKQDYAEAAANVIAGEGHENTVYELSGKPLTQEELVAIIENVINKKINVLQVDDAAYQDGMLKAGLPDFVVAMLVNIQKSIRLGALDIESNDLEKLLGRKPTPIAEALKQVL